MKKVTIKEVAIKAKVSPSTVSRVISDNPKISRETKERVIRCMDELGYYPNKIARSLANKKSQTLGIIMPSRGEDVFLNPFFPQVLSGILKEAASRDYDILISSGLDRKSEIQIIEKLINSSKVDGIIIMTSRLKDDNIAYLIAREFPFVLIGSQLEGEINNSINNIDNDNYRASYELTSYLISLGKKNIAMIGGDRDLVVTRRRIEGYKKALRDSKIKYRKEYLFTGEFTEEAGYKYGEKILKLDPRPDGIIVADDLVAFGTIRFLENMDIRIPEDIAIGSFNNSFLSRHSNKPFTSIDINPYDLGRGGVEMLIKAIDQGIRGQTLLIPYEIHKRESTGDRGEKTFS